MGEANGCDREKLEGDDPRLGSNLEWWVRQDGPEIIAETLGAIELDAGGRNSAAGYWLNLEGPRRRLARRLGIRQLLV